MTDPTDVVRTTLGAVAFGSWAPEAQRPDARVALDALDRLTARITELEAARDGEAALAVTLADQRDEMLKVVTAAVRYVLRGPRSKGAWPSLFDAVMGWTGRAVLTTQEPTDD